MGLKFEANGKPLYMPMSFIRYFEFFRLSEMLVFVYDTVTAFLRPTLSGSFFKSVGLQLIIIY